MLSNFVSAASKISSAVGLSSRSTAGSASDRMSRRKIVRNGRRTEQLRDVIASRQSAECESLSALRLHHDGCADMRGVEKLARFPIRHPNASVRRRNAGQIALVQSIPRRELQEVRHRRAQKMGMGRLRIFPHIHVWPNDSAGVVHVITVETGTVILVFADNTELTKRRSVPLTTARNSR